MEKRIGFFYFVFSLVIRTCRRMTDRFWSSLVVLNMEIIVGSPSINYAYASRLGYITVDCPVTIFSPENSDQIVCIRFKSNNQLVLMKHKIKSCCKRIARNTSITHLTKTNSVVNTEDHFVWFVWFTFENCTKPFFVRHISPVVHSWMLWGLRRFRFIWLVYLGDNRWQQWFKLNTKV